MLYLALGIIGATVMPHNLYLHSGIVQTRAYGETPPEKREAIKFATLDSTVALMFALTINASILILAAATFHRTGNTGVEELEQGPQAARAAARLGDRADAVRHRAAVLRPELDRDGDDGRQIVMEGFLDIRLPPWLRRLVTRAVAIVPAALVTIVYGESGTAKLLILSQVILEPAAALRHRAAGHVHRVQAQDGRARRARWLTALAGVIAAIVIALNVKVIVDFVWS